MAKVTKRTGNLREFAGWLAKKGSQSKRGMNAQLLIDAEKEFMGMKGTRVVSEIIPRVQIARQKAKERN